ncbi:MAG: hypothetical protein AAF184_03215 [Pseudomonadota bacterium]
MNDFQRFIESQRQAQGGAPAGGPGAFLARAVGMVAAVGVLAISLIFGAFVITAVLAIALVAAVAFRVWFWWHQRKLRASGSPHGPSPSRRPRPPPRAGGGDVVEGEFEVVEEHGDDDPHRPRS